jgi:hypothetical protein
MIDHKYKIEYLNLCKTFGTFEIDSIFTFERYKEIRKEHTQSQVINEIYNLLKV